MRRFFVDKIENEMLLTDEAHNHLSFVLRAKKGDEIILCDGSGFDYTAVVQDIKKNGTLVKIINKEKNGAEPSLKVTLYFAVLKGDKNDLVVQKATELGVYEIKPVLSKNISVFPSSVKTDRLNKIALESCKQCGRAFLPKVYSSLRLEDAADEFKNYDTVLFLYENADNCDSDLKSYLSSKKLNGTAAVMIGSEGGFTEDEASLLKQSGAAAVSLGRRILRAETASITALGILMYEAGQMK